MLRFTQHILFKCLSFALVLALLVPIAIKASHALNHHEHEICLGEYQTHLHELDLDCNFYKFKINQPYLFTFNQVESLLRLDHHKIVMSQYEFINDYQKLQCSLRGPPSINLI